MSPEAAEVVALQVLAWIVGNDDVRDVFLGASGASVDDLRTRAADVDFQGSVLGFLLMDDQWVIGFCDDLEKKGLEVWPGDWREKFPTGHKMAFLTDPDGYEVEILERKNLPQV